MGGRCQNRWEASYENLPGNFASNAGPIRVVFGA